VPDTTEVKIDPKTNTLIRNGVPSIVNPFDKNALEAALQLRKVHGGTVTVLSMGPPQAKDALKECLGIGADKAVLVSDRAFGGSDTLATSYILAKSIEKLGRYDLIICGKQAIDGDTAQVGPEIAEHLKIAQVTYVSKIKEVKEILTVERETEEGYEVIEVKTPALLTVVKSINTPRYPTIKNKLAANKKEIKIITAEDLQQEENKFGLKGSPTQVKKIFIPSKRTSGSKIQKETPRESVIDLLERLQEAKII
jgi:electron transfer flavoprotein beta subunit